MAIAIELFRFLATTLRVSLMAGRLALNQEGAGSTPAPAAMKRIEQLQNFCKLKGITVPDSYVGTPEGGAPLDPTINVVRIQAVAGI